MNIAVISRSTTAHFISGGMETQLKNLVEGLSELGHNVFVITTSYPVEGGIVRENKHENLNCVEYFYIGDTTAGLFPLSIFEIPWKILGLLNRGNKKEGSKNFFIESFNVFTERNLKKHFDVIISQSTGAYGIVGKTDIPIVTISHGTITNEISNRLKSTKTFKNWFRFLFIDYPKLKLELVLSNKKFYESVSAIVCVSSLLLDRFLEEYSLDSKNRMRNKSYVVYNGVDTKRFSPSNKPKDRFKLLYVGRIDREKGIDLVIQAISELKLRKIVVYANIVGGGLETSQLKQLAKSLNVDDLIDFIGQIENNQLPKYYNESSLFVFPSRRLEGQPMAVAESFCCGIPVISTKSGGLSEIINDGENGFFVRPEDYIDIANKVQALFVDKKRLKKMSENARLFGVKNFSKDSMVKNYEKLLESLSNGKRK